MNAAPFLVGVALDDPSPEADAGRWIERIRLAEQVGADLATIEDGPLDALVVAARIAPLTSEIGILPVVSATRTEPFHVSTALATLDFVSGGRAGWVATVEPRAEAEGYVTWTVPDDVSGDAAEHVEAVRLLWDSWEDGAQIRDGATDRFIDRDRVHHVDFDGQFLAVRGPSITPRPPQGHPPVAVRATDADAFRLASSVADVVLTTDADAPLAPGRRRILELDRAAGATGAAGALLDRARGFDGVLLHGEAATDLAGALVAELVARGDRSPAASGRSLRERLGLGAAVNVLVAAR